MCVWGGLCFGVCVLGGLRAGVARGHSGLAFLGRPSGPSRLPGLTTFLPVYFDHQSLLTGWVGQLGFERVHIRNGQWS